MDELFEETLILIDHLDNDLTILGSFLLGYVKCQNYKNNQFSS